LTYAGDICVREKVTDAHVLLLRSESQQIISSCTGEHGGLSSLRQETKGWRCRRKINERRMKKRDGRLAAVDLKTA
jgi:hypothetical protein